MNRDQVDAFLAEADDVIDDWEGSVDSATWAGDGSHETEISGDYYGNDGPSFPHDPLTCVTCRFLAGAWPALADWQLRLIDQVMSGIQQRVSVAPVLWSAPPAPLSRGGIYAAMAILDEARSAWVPIEGARVVMDDPLFGGRRPTASQTEADDEPSTDLADDRVRRARRHGRAAQESPYGPGRRR